MRDQIARIYELLKQDPVPVLSIIAVADQLEAETAGSETLIGVAASRVAAAAIHAAKLYPSRDAFDALVCAARNFGIACKVERAGRGDGLPIEI